MTNEEFKNNFVAFILTHGRADNVATIRSLRSSGYSGKIILVLDDEDEQRDAYFENYGKENCYVFCKQTYVETTDNIVRGNRGVIVYARNACFDIAESLGYKYFIELDDDYTNFGYRFDSKARCNQSTIRNLDFVMRRMLEYFISCPFASIAMAQGGDFIGGKGNVSLKQIGTKRKAMNSFICSTDRRFKFVGRINEDVNTYTSLATVGCIFLTIVQLILTQNDTQSKKGGMSDAYWDEGTFQKSFSSVVVCPSGVTIMMMGDSRKRLHHCVSWRHVAPKIIPEKYKKKCQEEKT